MKDRDGGNIMGVRRDDYILIGLDIGYDKFNEEKWEEYEEYIRLRKTGSMTYLIDGYSGKYFVVGEVIKCDRDGEDGLGLNSFSTTRDTEFIDSKKRVSSFIKEKFDIEDEPKLIVLTHWT